MGKQVVAFQAAMKTMADNFPGAFSGYTLSVTESHQSSKVDTSGTAKAIVESFNALGCGFDIADATLVRDVPTQLAPVPQGMGVPEEHLLGHAFHTYKLVSADGTVAFEFQHNVCGRSNLRGGHRRRGFVFTGCVLLTLVPLRPRRRGERRSLRTLPGVSLRPPLAFNPRHRRLSTPTDAFQLHPDVRSYGTTLRPR